MTHHLQEQHLGVSITPLDDWPESGLQRLADHTVLIVAAGAGRLKTDFGTYDFTGGAMMCFAPYQPFSLSATTPLQGMVLRFHASFFCMHQYERVVTCNGVLFNNIYQAPLLSLAESEAPFYVDLLAQMQQELAKHALGRYEILVSYLKIFLINLARLKLEQQPFTPVAIEAGKTPVVLQGLKDAIEAHYREKHAASDYAALLHMSPRALARLTRQYFRKTLTYLIAERIVMEAKRELYLTTHPVKQIAYGLGFADEYYFSRFFKKNAAVSPQAYRDTVGYGVDEQQ